jgi:hypothetical protein
MAIISKRAEALAADVAIEAEVFANNSEHGSSPRTCYSEREINDLRESVLKKFDSLKGNPQAQLAFLKALEKEGSGKNKGALERIRRECSHAYQRSKYDGADKDAARADYERLEALLTWVNGLQSQANDSCTEEIRKNLGKPRTLPHPFPLAPKTTGVEVARAAKVFANNSEYGGSSWARYSEKEISDLRRMIGNKFNRLNGNPTAQLVFLDELAKPGAGEEEGAMERINRQRRLAYELSKREVKHDDVFKFSQADKDAAKNELERLEALLEWVNGLRTQANDNLTAQIREKSRE